MDRLYTGVPKRALDVTVSSLMLVILSPLLALLWVLVRVQLGSPVWFRQLRPGRFGVPFTIYKLRTMTSARDANGELMPDSARLTKLGEFLRRTSLDELPELWNVLRGVMSLVGPRPLLMRYYPFFTEPEKARFFVRPGITGLAQVSGRNDLSWDERIDLDLDYVRDCSLARDIRILFLTLWRVFQRDGVQVDPGAVMLDFDEERKGRAESNVPTCHAANN
jgi:lipopolysaccharide/colanic/teichoic acid biosynthesis glycosyltransferase